MSIQVEHIGKQYGSFKALDDVSLTIANGELVALLGPSGSGKTTLLRIIAGLESPDAGSILLHGEESTEHSASKRGIGFVFQHYALFRHMTIFENVAFGLRVQSRKIRPPRREIRERVTELLRLVQLDSFARMYPDQLSGGQRQRVALARALAVKPKVLLLDEPFSALDAKVRKELRDWLRRIHDELHVTTVLVTHDQEEALEVADRVAILNRGKLEQIGTPQSIYDHPASPFVYNFLGNVNLFHGRLLADLSPQERGDSAEESIQSAIGFVRPHELGRVHTTFNASTIRAKLRKARKTTSSFSKREKMRRKPLSRLKSRSTSLRFLYSSRLYSQGLSRLDFGGTTGIMPRSSTSCLVSSPS